MSSFVRTQLEEEFHLSKRREKKKSDSRQFFFFLIRAFVIYGTVHFLFKSEFKNGFFHF